MNHNSLQTDTSPKRLDYSWLFSAKVLRWKSWFYDGLVPKLALDLGPVQASLRLEQFSRILNRSWLPRRLEIRNAVRVVKKQTNSDWNNAEVEKGLARQLLRYLARDCVMHGITEEQWSDLFVVSGFEYVDQARSNGQGLILLGSHLGGHLSGVHWMIHHGIKLRMLVQRPRHVSQQLNQWFDENHPICSQNDLFLKRNMTPTDAARRMMDARRLIQNGISVYLNCDIPWAGPNTDVYSLLGQEVRFQSIWIDLAMILQCPVVQVSCRQIAGGRFHLKFSQPISPLPGDTRADMFGKAMTFLEKEVLEYPDDAVSLLLWPQFRPGRGSST